MRAFIALDIPEEVREHISKLQERLDIDGKITRKKHLHLTLKFLGEVNEDKLKKVQERLESLEFGPFEAELAETGTFGKRIVWVRLKGADRLQRAIDMALKDLFEPEHRFMSHITIARPRKIRNIPENKEKIRFKVDSFSLKKSILSPEGPEYSTLARFKCNL